MTTHVTYEMSQVCLSYSISTVHFQHSIIMFEDEFDNLPDDFADISGVDWARILAGPSTTPTSAEEQHPVLPRTGEHIPIPASSHSSTDYYLQDDFDPSLLAELDRIEGELAETSNLISGGKGYF